MKSDTIHPSTIIEKDVSVGCGTKIWQHCHINNGVVIGNDCIIGRGVFVNSNVKIGNKVKIQNFVHLSSGAILEDFVFVGPHVVFIGDLTPRSVNPDLTLKKKTDWKNGNIKIMAGASIGANSTIICNTVIGQWSMVGAGSVVCSDVPDYTLVVGNPSKIIGYVCRCGKRQESLHAAKNCEICSKGTKIAI